MNRRIWSIATLCFALLLGAGEPAAPPTDVEARVRDLVSQLPGGDTTSRYRAKLAVQKLVRIGKPAVPQLIEATQSEDPWVRSWSASALGGIRDERAAPALAALLKDDNGLVRCVALWNLSGFAQGSADYSTAIAKCLADPNEDVRTWAYRGITSRKLTAAAPALAKLLKHEDLETRRLAFTARALLQERLPADDARNTLTDRSAPAMRETALSVIRHEGPVKAEWAPFYLNALKDAAEPVKAQAVLGLEWLLKGADKLDPGQEKTIKDALEADLPTLTHAKFPRLRGQALRVLARAKGQDILPQLLDATRDEAAVVRANALQGLALAGIRSGEVMDAVVGALDDEDAVVRHWAGAAWRWVTANAVNLPYSPNAPESERKKQVAAIRAWRAEGR